MKQFCTGIFIFCFGILHAQIEVAVTADQIMIPEDHYQQLDNILGGDGPIVRFRVYAEFPEGLQLSAIYGTSTEGVPFSISSGNTFYQNPNGSALGFDIDANSPDPLVEYDSWFTIGAENSAEAAAYSGTTALELIPFFDNFELGYDVAVDTESPGISEAGLFVFNDFDQQGNPVTDLNQPDENGRVLIGQFTTRQFVSGCFTFSLNDITTEFSPPIHFTACFSFSPEFLSADFDENGIVDLTDLALILDNFGCIGGCNGDLTGDDMITVDDLTTFIYFYQMSTVIE